MKGKISSDGKVTIVFNSQCECLPGPEGGKYMPCEECGKIEEVDLNVVAHLCDNCYNKIGCEHTDVTPWEGKNYCDHCGREV